MRVSPEQLRKALADMFRDPKTRGLIFPYLAPRFPAHGAICTSTADYIPRFTDGNCTIANTATPMCEKASKIGIGTTDPHALLDVGGFDYAHSNSPTVGKQRNASASYSTTNMLSGGSALALTASQNDLSKVVALQLMDFNANGAIGLTYDSTQKGSLVFGTSTGGGDPAPVIERMRITGDGNVGIGTPTPANKLDVVGDIGIKSGGSLKLYDSGNTDSVELSYTTIAQSGAATAVGSENPLVANAATEARTDMATVNIGDGAWNGGAGAFSGSAAGTLLGANAASGFTGALMDLQVAGVGKLFVAANGKVGIGTTSDLSTLTVKANASFDAAGTVEIVAGSINVNGTSTTFKSQVSVGDKIRVTTGGTTYTRTVISVPSDVLLTVDTAFPVPASGLTMKVLPSIAKLLGADGNIKFIIDDSGFLGLARTTVNDNEKVGYVICNADVQFNDPAGVPSNNNQEMRGYQATMRYTRNSPDGNVIYSEVTTSGSSVQRTGGRPFVTGGAWNGLRIDIADKSFVIASVTDASNLTLTTTPTPAYSSAVRSAVYQTSPIAGSRGEGWDVIPHVGAISLENMNLPTTDPDLRGQMKAFQSELYFNKKAATGAKYNVLEPAINYLASLTRVEAETPLTDTCSIDTWAGFAVGRPSHQGGAAGRVTKGYGVWIQDLVDPEKIPATATLVEANAAAIKIDGLGNYGRIQWTSCSAYCPSSGVLEFSATTVQTGSGVDFNVGGSGGNAYCNAKGFRVEGGAASGNYLRGNGTNFVSSTIQAADLPDASATASGKVNTSTQSFAGTKTFTGSVGIGVDLGVTRDLFVERNLAVTASIYTPGVMDAASYKVNGAAGADGSFTTADGKTVTVVKGIITSIV